MERVLRRAALSLLLISGIGRSADASVPSFVTLSVGTVGVSTADGVQYLDLGDSGGNGRVYGAVTLRASGGDRVSFTQSYYTNSGIYHGTVSGGPSTPRLPSGDLWEKNYASVGWANYGGVDYTLGFQNSAGAVDQQNYMGFLVWGLRAADTLTFSSGGYVAMTLTGADIIRAAGSGASYSKAYYVNVSFTEGRSFDSLRLRNSMEFQNSSTQHWFSVADIAFGSVSGDPLASVGPQVTDPVQPAAPGEAPAPVVGSTPVGSAAALLGLFGLPGLARRRPSRASAT